MPLVEERAEHGALLVRVVDHQRVLQDLLELRGAAARGEQLHLFLRRHLADGVVAKVHGPRELHDGHGFGAVIGEAPERAQDFAAAVAVGEIFEDAARGPHGRTRNVKC